MKSKILKSICLASLLLIVSCSGSEENNTPGAANLSEQQKQEAVNNGRTAARAIINVDDKDTFALQGKLMEARAKQSEYVSTGRKVEAEIFDTAFIHTLRAVKPELARQIEQQP